MENNIFNFRIEEQEEEIFTPFFPSHSQDFDESLMKTINYWDKSKNKEENEIIDLLKELIMKDSKENK